MRKKIIGNAGFLRTITRYDRELRRTGDGVAALTVMREVPKPLIVDARSGAEARANPGDVRPLCLAGDGYRWLSYLPDGAYWGFCAIFNADGALVEWYYDMTRANFTDGDGEPCYDDLYLDIALMPDGAALTLDDDELQDALDGGVISRADFELAWATHDALIADGTAGLAGARALTARLLALFDDIQEGIPCLTY